MKKISIPVAFLFVMLIGCVPATYMMGGQTYQTSAEGLAAQRAMISQILSKVDPVPRPFAGRAIVFIPSDADLRARGVVRTGTPPPEVEDYVAMTNRQALATFHEIIAKRALFESADLQDVIGTARPEIGPGEHAVWVQLLAPNQSGWKYFTAEMTEPVTILVDNSLPLGGARYVDWLERLAHEVARNGGRLVDGAASRGSSSSPQAPSVSNNRTAPLPASSSGPTGAIKRTLN
jgi:hypothetical protein